MTRRRWIADEFSGNRAALIGEHARHLSQVLRAKSGQQFDLSAGGELRRARIIKIAADRVEFELGDIIIQPTLPPPFTIALSIFKFDRMEWAIEKCTELGVARIIPVIAARSEPHLVVAAAKRLERWQRIVRSASEQSRRISPPAVSEPLKLNALHTATEGTRIVLSEIETEQTLRDAVPQDVSSLTLAFGPEGGWKNAELEKFHTAGWTTASLGPTILRAETAVIAAVAVASSVLMADSCR